MPHTDELATVQTHQPWCRNHHVMADEPHDIGWCQNTVLLERTDPDDPRSTDQILVDITPRGHDETDPAIAVYIDESRWLDPADARRVAAALTAAADLLERVAQ